MVSLSFMKEEIYEALFLTFSFAIILCFLDHTHFNGIDEFHDKDLLNKFRTRLYFSNNDFSTIGYGDISPKSDIARTICILIHFMVILSIRKWFGKY